MFLQYGSFKDYLTEFFHLQDYEYFFLKNVKVYREKNCDFCNE